MKIGRNFIKSEPRTPTSSSWVPFLAVTLFVCLVIFALLEVVPRVDGKKDATNMFSAADIDRIPVPGLMTVEGSTLKLTSLNDADLVSTLVSWLSWRGIVSIASSTTDFVTLEAIREGFVVNHATLRNTSCLLLAIYGRSFRGETLSFLISKNLIQLQAITDERVLLLIHALQASEPFDTSRLSPVDFITARTSVQRATYELDTIRKSSDRADEVPLLHILYVAGKLIEGRLAWASNNSMITSANLVLAANALREADASYVKIGVLHDGFLSSSPENVQDTSPNAEFSSMIVPATSMQQAEQNALQILFVNAFELGAWDAFRSADMNTKFIGPECELLSAYLRRSNFIAPDNTALPQTSFSFYLALAEYCAAAYQRGWCSTKALEIGKAAIADATSSIRRLPIELQKSYGKHLFESPMLKASGWFAERSTLEILNQLKADLGGDHG